MILVDWQEDDKGQIWLLHCQGHAGFEGELDLVCAAVSALTGALGIAFTQVVELPNCLEVADGNFRLALTTEVDQPLLHPEFVKAQVVLKTTVLALQEMIEHYPGFIARKPA